MARVAAAQSRPPAVREPRVPVIAEAKTTGVSVPSRTPRRSARRTWLSVAGLPSTHLASTRSSTSATAVTTASSRSDRPSTRARGDPSPCTRVRTTTCGVNRVRTRWSAWRTSEPGRSTLLSNSTVGTPIRCSARQMTTVCGCTPSTADSTSTAASSTPRARSTSAMKSGCPGVSRRFTSRSSIASVVTAARIVMPRRRSRSIESVRVLPWSTLPSVSITPAS